MKGIFGLGNFNGLVQYIQVWRIILYASQATRVFFQVFWWQVGGNNNLLSTYKVISTACMLPLANAKKDVLFLFELNVYGFVKDPVCL